MAERSKNGIKYALPLLIQIFVIIGGGIAFFWQVTSALRADVQESTSEIIRKVDKTENKVEVVQEEVEEVKVEQKQMKIEILEAVDMDVDNKMLKHRVKCHNKKCTRCNPP